MFESTLASVLKEQLREYVELQNSDVGLGLRGGHVSLDDVQLRIEQLNKCSLPFQILSGHAGRLRVDVPWSALSSSPVSIYVENVHITAGPLVGGELAASAKYDEKANAVERMQAEENNNNQDYDDDEEQDENTWHRTYLHRLATNVSTEIAGFKLEYADENCDMTISFASTRSYTCNSKWQPSFSTLENIVDSDLPFVVRRILDIEGLQVLMLKNHTGRAAPRSDAEPARLGGGAPSQGGREAQQPSPQNANVNHIYQQPPPARMQAGAPPVAETQQMSPASSAHTGSAAGSAAQVGEAGTPPREGLYVGAQTPPTAVMQSGAPPGAEAQKLSPHTPATAVLQGGAPPGTEAQMSPASPAQASGADGGAAVEKGGGDGGASSTADDGQPTTADDFERENPLVAGLNLQVRAAVCTGGDGPHSGARGCELDVDVDEPTLAVTARQLDWLERIVEDFSQAKRSREAAKRQQPSGGGGGGRGGRKTKKSWSERASGLTGNAKARVEKLKTQGLASTAATGASAPKRLLKRWWGAITGDSPSYDTGDDAAEVLGLTNGEEGEEGEDGYMEDASVLQRLLQLAWEAGGITLRMRLKTPDWRTKTENAKLRQTILEKDRVIELMRNADATVTVATDSMKAAQEEAATLRLRCTQLQRELADLEGMFAQQSTTKDRFIRDTEQQLNVAQDRLMALGALEVEQPAEVAPPAPITSSAESHTEAAIGRAAASAKESNASEGAEKDASEKKAGLGLV